MASALQPEHYARACVLRCTDKSSSYSNADFYALLPTGFYGIGFNTAVGSLEPQMVVLESRTPNAPNVSVVQYNEALHSWKAISSARSVTSEDDEHFMKITCEDVSDALNSYCALDVFYTDQPRVAAVFAS